MLVGADGLTSRGYETQALRSAVDRFFLPAQGQKLAVVGVGKLGRAMIEQIERRRPLVRVVAAFDRREDRIDRVIMGVRCHHVNTLRHVVQTAHITLGLLAVPSEAAQQVTDALVASDVLGILNFSAATLRVPAGVHVVDVDVMVALEKLAFSTANKCFNQRGDE